MACLSFISTPCNAGSNVFKAVSSNANSKPMQDQQRTSSATLKTADKKRCGGTLQDNDFLHNPDTLESRRVGIFNCSKMKLKVASSYSNATRSDNLLVRADSFLKETQEILTFSFTGKINRLSP